MGRICTLIVALGVLASTPAARGVTFSTLGVIAVVDGFGGGNPAYSDDVQDSIGGIGSVGPISVSAVDPYGRGSSFAWSEIVSTPGYTSLRVSTSNGAGAQSTAGAIADAFYQDTIFVDGQSGDPVTLEISWLLSYSLTSNPGTSGLCGQDEARIQARLNLGSSSATFADSTCTGVDGEQYVTLIENTFSGAELDFSAFVSAHSLSGYTGSSSADADKSLTPFIRSLTDGYSYTTASGNTYFPSDQPNPVPEGSSLLLLLGGLVAAASWGRRRGTSVASKGK